MPEINGADGIVFAIQTTGPTALGGSGGLLGCCLENDACRDAYREELERDFGREAVQAWEDGMCS